VVLLEDAKGRIAMQLRDDRPGVSYPGHWGLFGGGREAGETPEEAGIREVREELGRSLDPSRLRRLDTQIVAWPNGALLLPCRVHVFHYPLADELAGAKLHEGRAFAAMAPKQIRAARVVPSHLGILEWFWARR
jgi:8-oxo-dGTP diphosphatase